MLIRHPKAVVGPVFSAPVFGSVICFGILIWTLAFASPVLAQRRPAMTDQMPQLIVPQSLLNTMSGAQKDEAGWGAPRYTPSHLSGDAIEIDALGTLETGAVGLEPGYGPEIWHGSRAAYTIGLLDRVSVDGNIDMLRRMEISLLRGRAPGPLGVVDHKTWFAARIDRLLHLGDSQSIVGLMQLTGAEKRDARAAQSYIASLLYSGNLAQACNVRDRTALEGGTLFALELGILCQIYAGDLAAATLAIELHNASLSADPFFKDLAFFYAVDAPLSDAALPARLSPLHFALMLVTKYPMPAEMSYFVPASYSFLALNYNLPAEQQLTAAARAVALGLMPVERFGEIAQLLPLEPATPQTDEALAGAGGNELPNENTLNPLEAQGAPIIETAKQDKLPPASLAELVRAWRGMAMRPVDGAELSNFLQEAYRLGHWDLAVHLIAPRLSLLQPDESPVLALAFLTLNRPDLARSFLPVDLPAQQRPPSHRDLRDVLRFWQGGSARMTPAPKVDDLLAAEATFIQVLAQSLHQPLQAMDDYAVDSARVERARLLVGEGRLGDLVLHMRGGLADRSWSQWSRADTVLAIAPLAALGLNYEADRSAREVLLGIVLETVMGESQREG